MSTLRIRHYSKKSIAQKDIVRKKRQYVKALYLVNEVFLFLLKKMKIGLILPRSVEDYLKVSFIVIKNDQNENFDLG